MIQISWLPSKKPWTLAFGALIIIVILAFVKGRGPAGPAGPSASHPVLGPITVRAETARRGPLALHLHALGNVTAFNTTTVKTQAAGTLIKIHFAEGQDVKAGDLLAEIDPRLYQSQLDQALGKLSSDRAQLRFAEAELVRDQHLVKEGFIALSQLQTQSASVNQLKGIIATDQAQVDAARVQLSYCRITAPLSGRVGLKRVDVGNVLNTLDPLVIITQMQPITVIFSIPQDQNARLQARLTDPSGIVVDAFDRDGQVRLGEGQLTSVDNLMDSATGTLKVKAVFDNPDLRLYPNQFVNVRLMIETLEDRVIIPRRALQQNPAGYHVFTLEDNGTAKMTAVQPGPSEGEALVIENGVREGQQVITEGLDKLKDGTRVQAAAATPSSSGPGNVKTPAIGAGH